ncbi:lysoplasmalogenase [Brachybacterium hainanense]|uniref:Lysoplasmalogenase n=1 Tax=Brachybacterium hainanense TaxID=1541174 RepID=A0ABV6R811_9MICO
MRRPSRWRKLAGAAFVVVAATHVAAKAVAPDSAVCTFTQALLMPALAGVLLAPPGPVLWGTDPLPRRVLAALALSWLGDTLPRLSADPDRAFLLMLGPFLLAQGAYISAFWPHRRTGIPGLRRGRRVLALAPYGAALTAIVALCAPRSGPMLPAILVYGGALVSMAVLSTGLGPVAGAGGAVFLASDSLIGLEAFADLRLPMHGAWVMTTYLAGQGLLVLAVRRRCPRAE